MEACIPNIGGRQRRRRLVLGLLSLAAAVAAAVVLADAGAAVRALLFLPLYGAALGFMQFRERT